MSSLIKSQNLPIYGPYDKHITCDLICPQSEDKTKQSFAHDCDINVIMSRFLKTGIVEHGNSQSAYYGEASAFDFQEAQNILISAENMFNALPAGIRAKFENNPVSLLEFMDNPQNRPEAVALGLYPAPEGVSEGNTSLAPEGATSTHKTPTKGEGAPTKTQGFIPG